jgi:tripartite-type tricarboxylate transporter receptor subunit TctC
MGRRRQALGLAAAIVLGATVGAAAAGFPDRPVRIVVGFAAGGGADTATRLFAGQLSALWGQQIVVENRGGAGGIMAAETVARARIRASCITARRGSAARCT